MRNLKQSAFEILATSIFICASITPNYAATTGGVDTPAGVNILPLAIQGQEGLVLSIPDGGAPGVFPTVTIPGNAEIGTLTVDNSVTAQDYFYLSDARLKQDIHAVKGLKIIEKLNGVAFNWKSNQQPSAGILAQDVEKVMPNAVRTRPDGYKTVEYSQLIAPMIESIKELKAQNDRLVLQNNKLAARLTVVEHGNQDGETLKRASERESAPPITP